jgi:hypothetical protein
MFSLNFLREWPIPFLRLMVEYLFCFKEIFRLYCVESTHGVNTISHAQCSFVRFSSHIFFVGLDRLTDRVCPSSGFEVLNQRLCIFDLAMRELLWGLGCFDFGSAMQPRDLSWKTCQLSQEPIEIFDRNYIMYHTVRGSLHLNEQSRIRY